MRLTLRGESERTLIELSRLLDVSPTALVTHCIFTMENLTANKAHIEEVKNELYKSHKRVIQKSYTHINP